MYEFIFSIGMQKDLCSNIDGGDLAEIVKRN